MPWQKIDEQQHRWQFLKRALRAPAREMAALCREFGISRKTGYKWLGRWRHGGQQGLKDRSRRPKRLGRSWAAEWKARVLAAQRKHRGVGARKLRAILRRAHRRARVPAERTIHRWLRAAGRVRTPRRSARPGPWEEAKVPLARRPNDVWTMDFKGAFRTADGTLVQPLTVRDLASRLVLGIRHLPKASERGVARYSRGLFGRHGLPRAIRIDRGAPFASEGPRRWSRLSAGWVRLGIAVQITRRARPSDNGAHEQMHRILKADTASPPAPTLAAQQRRFERWRRWYNEQRPHAALGQRVPAALYCDSPRRLPRQLPALVYPAHWASTRVTRQGYIRWAGQLRGIGRAFYAHRVGLRPVRGGVEVYFGSYLLGTLTPADHALRAVRVRPAH